MGRHGRQRSDSLEDEPLRGVLVAGVGERYNFRYSRSRRVCVRLTGISVAFASFILRM